VRVLLDAHLDGDLAPERGVRVEAHLAECASCRHELEDARRLRDTLRSLPQHTSTRATRQPVAVSQPAPPPTTPGRAVRRRAQVTSFWRPLAVAALLAGVVFGAVRVLHRPVVESAVTAQDVARAELQVRWVMARLGEINRRTGARVREDVIEKGVVEPSARAVESALDQGVAQ